MKEHSGITKHVISEIFDAAGEAPLPILDQLRISIHLFFCPCCSQEAKKLEMLREIMDADFFPPCPDFGERVMEKLNIEEDVPSYYPAPASAYIGWFSTRSWIIAGCFMVLSLVTVFFGLDFTKVANDYGSSFLLPIGLITGLILTAYVALFIGSHLKELSAWFRLH